MQTLSSPNSNASIAYTRQAWKQGYESQPQEFDYWIEDIEGEIPAELSGTVFRNGPGLTDINGYRLRHPFDGDGMINSIAIAQGQAYYRNRFVRTEGYLKEQKSGKPEYRGVFGTQKPGGWLANAFDIKLKNIANTHVVYWGGKLLALWEAAQPHRLDPNTLATLGLDNLDGILTKGEPFAAHPKFDPTALRPLAKAKREWSLLVSKADYRAPSESSSSIPTGPLPKITDIPYQASPFCMTLLSHPTTASLSKTLSASTPSPSSQAFKVQPNASNSTPKRLQRLSSFLVTARAKFNSLKPTLVLCFITPMPLKKTASSSSTLSATTNFQTSGTPKITAK